MPVKRKPSAANKLKDLRPKAVSAAKASKTKGGDAASGLATGKRMHKPY